MTGELRVAVWGLGGHAERRLLPALARCSATTIAGVTTRDASRGGRLAALHGCPYWESPEAMLASAAIDVVLVATPIGCHAAQGRAVLDSGKSLWCEKSLAATEPDAQDLIAEARRRALVLAECFMFLYHPQFRRVEAEAASLGGIASVGSRFYMRPLAQPGFRHSVALGGGGLLDVGCYPLRAASALLGDELEVCHARLDRPAGFDVDMTGRAVLASRSGSIAMLEWGFGPAYRNELSVCGATGSLDADRIFSKGPDHVSTIALRDESGAPRTLATPAADSFVEMFDELAAAQRDDARRESLYACAAAQARLLAAVRRAAS